MVMTKAYLFNSQLNEVSLTNLDVVGNIPPWLTGNFVSNGPAQFELGSLYFNHWFDGFAMLRKFYFEGGEVSFQNRFLKSSQYKISNKSKHLHCNEFGTYADSTFTKRLIKACGTFFKGYIYDNCNINTLCIDNHIIAMTETVNQIAFNLNDLSTVGIFHYEDDILGQLSTAHPHIDMKTGEVINVVIDIGYQTEYHIYKIAPHSIKRQMIQTYISNFPFYMHSFSITPNYIILFKSPLIINKYKLLLGLPFNKTLSWLKNAGSYFVIIDRRNGEIYEIETDPFVCLHSVNAYEHRDQIILDLICYTVENPYNYFYLQNLQSKTGHLPSTTLNKYIINLKNKSCCYEIISSLTQDLPRINYQFNGQSYSYMYSCLKANEHEFFFNAIQKINVNTGESCHWSRTNYVPGEPIFVKRPNAKTEDDGVLLSIAYHSKIGCSCLIVLNAITLQQLAEVMLPLHLPFGLHGNFYP